MHSQFAEGSAAPGGTHPHPGRSPTSPAIGLNRIPSASCLPLPSECHHLKVFGGGRCIPSPSAVVLGSPSPFPWVIETSAESYALGGGHHLYFQPAKPDWVFCPPVQVSVYVSTKTHPSLGGRTLGTDVQPRPQCNSGDKANTRKSTEHTYKGTAQRDVERRSSPETRPLSSPPVPPVAGLSFSSHRFLPIVFQWLLCSISSQTTVSEWRFQA